MPFNFRILAILLGLTGAAVASPSRKNQRRAVTSNVTLYVYGNGIDGFPIYYGDGNAYIGASEISIPSFISVAANVTFSTDQSTSTTPWTIDSPQLNSTRTFYLNTSEGAFDQLGFTPNTSSLPSDLSYSGFSFMGTQVYYAADDSNWESQFWAKRTNDTNCWSLMWNAEAVVQDDAVSVVVKTTAPVSPA